MTEKIALVLGGGGVTGVAFEMGVLRALEEVWLNRGVEELDLYFGTSAGAYVAAYLASGLSQPRLRRLLRQDRGFSANGGPLATFFPNVGELVEKGLFWPLTLLNMGGAMLRAPDPVTGVTRAVEELLPTGLFDTWLMQQALYRSYRRHGVGNRFADLPRALHVIAADLDSGARVVFNRENPAPLEKAVAASCAIPLFYRPVRIRGREYVDGGVRGTASIDLAVTAGASLVIVVNSLVPFRNNPQRRAYQHERGEPDGHISHRGPVAITNQVSRAAIHNELLQQIDAIKRQRPDVRIMLIEPSPQDARLSFRNIMSFRALDQVAAHGFHVGMSFWHRNADDARPILDDHGIRLATRLQMPIAG